MLGLEAFVLVATGNIESTVLALFMLSEDSRRVGLESLQKHEPD